MTFGRWLLVHSFSICLVVLLVLGYVYREELRLQQAYSQLLSMAPYSGDDLTRSQQKKTDDTEQATEVEPVETPQAEVVQPAQAAPRETSESVQPVERSAPETQDIPLQAQPTIVDEEIELDELLLQARRAFWDKRFDQAITHYQQLLQQQPRDPDLLGELGNVYYAMNNYPQAAQIYYRAAELLIEQGEVRRAGHLVAPITAMQRELGNRLKQRLKEE